MSTSTIIKATGLGSSGLVTGSGRMFHPAAGIIDRGSLEPPDWELDTPKNRSIMSIITKCWLNHSTGFLLKLYKLYKLTLKLHIQICFSVPLKRMGVHWIDDWFFQVEGEPPPRSELINPINTIQIGGIPTPLKNMEVSLDLHPNYWGTFEKNIFQTTNQYTIVTPMKHS